MKIREATQMEEEKKKKAPYALNPILRVISALRSNRGFA